MSNGTINKVILVGRLGSDPEVRTAQNGQIVVKFPLATNTGYGERKKTDWHRVTVFGRTAEACAKYLSKGSNCYLEGRISYNRYEKDNAVRYFTDVLSNSVSFLSPKPVDADVAEGQLAEEQVTSSMEHLPF